MTTLDTARLREVAEATRLSPGGVERVEADAVNYAFFGAFDPPTVLALLDRLDAAEAALGKVLGLAEAATEQAYMQIATEKMLTVQPTALGGAKVPPHWRTEAEAEATIAVRPQIVGNIDAGFTTAYYSDLVRNPNRRAAIRHGWQAEGHDDWLLAHVRGNELLMISWQYEDRPDEDEERAGIAATFGWICHRGGRDE